jgi:hypothetical protein
LSTLEEGTMEFGPYDAVRLEATRHAGKLVERILVVCDGTQLVEERRVENQAPGVTLMTLPAGDNRDARALALRGKGVIGPAESLADIVPCVDAGAVETGLLRGQPVVRLTFAVTRDPRDLGATQVDLYLEPTNLVPREIAWRVKDKTVLRQEWRDVEANRPRTLEECMRLFSYQPGS